MRFEVLEDVLPHDHRARLLWRVVETLELSELARGRKSVKGMPGGGVMSARVLLTLWLYGISSGIGSAREIARRIGPDDAFRWIAGEERAGRTVLSEFRAHRPDALDLLFSDVLGTVLRKGLLSLALVAQDGKRVRASASAPSFDGRHRWRRVASRPVHVMSVLAEVDDPDATDAEKPGREAAAHDHARRVEEAIVVMKALAARGKRSRALRRPTPKRA